MSLEDKFTAKKIGLKIQYKSRQEGGEFHVIYWL